MKTHVFIGTTCGPVAIQRITPEESGVQSVVCLNGTVHALPISAAYHDFVRRGTGIVARDFQHDAFRVDVAERIDQGVSWQLPMYVAHAVQANGELGNGQPESGDCVIWATGEVGADGVVRPVERTADKLKQSLAQIQQWRKRGIQVRILLPDTNLAEGVEQVSDLAGVAGVHTLAEALQSFSGKSKDAGKGRFRGGSSKAAAALGLRPGWWAFALLLVVSLLGVYWAITHERSPEEVIILDDFGGQVTRPAVPTGRNAPVRGVESEQQSIQPPTADVFGLFGDDDCDNPAPVALGPGRTGFGRTTGDHFCGLTLSARGNVKPLVIALPSGRAIAVGPLRRGRRSVLLEPNNEPRELLIVWPDAAQALRIESNLRRWLDTRVGQAGGLDQQHIEQWMAANGGQSELRFIRFAR